MAATATTATVEQAIEQLLQNCIELGICASDVQEIALERTENGMAHGVAGGLIGKKTSQTVAQMKVVHELQQSVHSVMVPVDVIKLVDEGKNPHLYTRDLVDRVAGENMYTNGILSGIADYSSLLTAKLAAAFPHLVHHLLPPPPSPASSALSPSPSAPSDTAAAHTASADPATDLPPPLHPSSTLNHFLDGDDEEMKMELPAPGTNGNGNGNQVVQEDQVDVKMEEEMS